MGGSREALKLEMTMSDPSELEFAKRLALFHDHVRREVTESLRWALDTIKTHGDRMPKDEVLALEYLHAEKALKTSERLTKGYGPERPIKEYGPSM